MKPAARVTLNGKDVTTAWASVLESITITDEAGVKSDSCEVAFDAREGFSAPPIGAELKVWLGYEPQPVYMGSYKVDSWAKSYPPRRLTVSAKAADMTGAIRAPKVRSFHEKTVKDIVGQVAGDNGLSPLIDDKIGGTTVEHIDQQGESDIAFLSRLAKRHGATFKVADGKAIFAAKGSKTAPSGKAKQAITLTPINLASWSANCSERGGFKSASAGYMDHVAGKRKTARVKGTAKPHHRDRRLYGSKAEAEAAAKANLGDLTRGKVSVTIEMVGTPTLFAEALVTLKDCDPDVDGEFLAKSVTHTYGGGAFRTSLSLETGGADTGSDSAE